MPDFETTIIGAGVIGLAIAARLSARGKNIVVLEKNAKYGLETSSRNSEVIHAGIYYKRGSLKARLCIEGRDELYSICKDQNIAHRQIAKIITATNEEELKKLEMIFENGRANGVELQMLDKQATLKLEPNVNAVGSVFSPHTGVMSAHQLMDYFYHTTVNNGVTVQFYCQVLGIERSNAGYTVAISESGQRSSFTSEKVINAAGLHADEIAAMVGIDLDAAGYHQHWAKGSYFAVAPSRSKVVSRLIYPVPQNEGLGVHALIDWGGRLKFGPDVEYLSERKLDYSVDEGKKKAFAESIRRIVPAITEGDISPDMSGIRAKLQRKGEPPKDFLIVHEKERGLEGFVNLLGIDSPGLTASPAIAKYVEMLF